MPIRYKQAAREGRIPLLIGLSGPSGGGKTYSALRLATGLANGRPIFFIDTENHRALHYADSFSFMHGDLTAPFSPSAYLEAIQEAEKAGAAVCIVDSFSHEHEGTGGVLDMHDAELTRMAGDDYRKREQMTFSAWRKPKSEHQQLVNHILAINMDMIFCLRAKQKIKLVRNEKGKMEPVPRGWVPICPDRFDYELTVNLMLPELAMGVPELGNANGKIPGQFRPLFQPDEPITEALGKRLLEWGESGTPSKMNTDALIGDARAAADLGAANFREYWKRLSKQERGVLKPMIDDLQRRCTQADEGDDDPFSGRGDQEEGAGEPEADEGTQTPEKPDSRAQGASPPDQGRNGQDKLATIKAAMRGADGPDGRQAVFSAFRQWIDDLPEPQFAELQDFVTELSA